MCFRFSQSFKFSISQRADEFRGCWAQDGGLTLGSRLQRLGLAVLGCGSRVQGCFIAFSLKVAAMWISRHEDPRVQRV